MNGPVYLYGAGGHARVVLSVLEALGLPIGGLFDDSPARSDVAGYPVLGPFRAGRVESGGSLVLAIGSNEARRHLAEKLEAQVAWADALVHPAAIVHPGVALGAGTVVFAGGILQPGTVVGRHAIINTAATVDHDGRLGDFAHLAPGVHLAGDVHVGEGGFLGVGAGVVPGCRIGAWSIVGAGGVVTRDLPERVTAVGVPTRIIKHHRSA